MSSSLPPFCRRSDTWSILQSLATLSPPPSYSSLAHLSTLCSSGDIPIFLHHGIEAPPNGSPSTRSIASMCLAFEEREDNEIITSIPSTGTIDSVRTFGPMHLKVRRPTMVTRDSDGRGEALELVRSSAAASTPPRPITGGLRTPDSSPLRRRGRTTATSPNSRLRNLKPLAIPIINPLDAQSSRAEDGEKSDPLSASELGHLDEDGGQMLLLTPSQSLSTLSTPMFAPPSACSLETPDLSPNRPFKSRLRYAVSKGMSYVASRPSSQTGSPADVPSGTRSVPGSPCAVTGSPKIKIFGRSRNGSTSTTASTSSSRSSQPAASFPTMPSVSSIDLWRYAYLPISLSWLKETIVELLIDQEGFRSIRPAFRLVGYSGPPAAEGIQASLNMHLTSAQADFMPAKRQSFVFHHALLDTAPVLRRVIINGDESRDHTSRQASLNLKLNGAYTVRGTEAFHPHRRDSHTESEVLTWKFDYFVTDRRTESGKIVSGEKTITPLCFSCSPGLLHRDHSKKVRFVHVVKKSVVQKLASEKVEPPAPPPSYAFSRGSATVSYGTGPVKENPATGHRRVRSHALSRSVASPDLANGIWHTAVPSSNSYQGGPPGLRESSYSQKPANASRHSATEASKHILSDAVIASMFAEPILPVARTPIAPLSPPRHHRRRSSVPMKV